MFFSGPESPWPIALADSMLVGILGIIILLVVITIIMNLIHSLSGYNGTKPSVWFYREAKAWWKEPHV